LACRSSNDDFRITNDRQGRHLGRGIAMCKTTADRAAVADLVMRHMGYSCGQYGEKLRQDRAALDIAPARKRPDGNHIAFDSDRVERLNTANVNQNGRTHETERHHRQKTLPAGDDPRFAVASGEMTNCIFYTRRPYICERWKLHSILDDFRGDAPFSETHLAEAPHSTL